MKKIAVVLILVVAGITFASVDGKAEGQVYVVTKGRGSVEMPMVNIYTVSESDIAYETDRLERALSDCPNNEDLEKALVEGTVDEFEELNAAKDDCYWQGINSFLSSIPVSSQTNSTGEFSIDVPRFEKSILIATGSRSIPLGGDERYLWIKPVDLGWKLSQDVDINNGSIIPLAGVQHVTKNLGVRGELQ